MSTFDRRQIVEALEGSLDSGNTGRRLRATEALKEMQSQAGFCIELVRLALRDGDGGGESADQLAIRQYAIVHFKNVVAERWSKLGKLYAGGPLISDGEKEALRKELPRGLSHPEAKLRVACAHALSTIGAWDWPERWPGFVADLVKCLASANAQLVHGALTCLSWFARSGKLVTKHFPKLVPLLLPALLKLYQSGDRFPAAVRLRVLPILSSCVEGVLTLRAAHKKDADAMLKKAVTPWLPHIAAALSRKPDSDDAAAASDCREQIYSLATLHLMFAEAAQLMVPFLPKLLPPVFHSVVSCAALFQSCAVDRDACELMPADEDGNSLGLATYVIYLLDLLRIIIEFKALRKAIAHNVGHILYYTVAFLQVTVDDEQQWQADTDDFVASEEDVGADLGQSVRSAAAQLLTELFDRAQRDGTLVQTARAFTQAVKKHCTASSSSSERSRWTIVEACIHAVGLVHKQLLLASKMDSSPAVFDLAWFFRQLLVPAVRPSSSSSSSSSTSSSPFLKARALWAIGRLSDRIPADNVDPFLQFTVQILAGKHDAALKIGACLALKGFLPKLPAETVRPLLAKVVPPLCSLLGQVPPNTLHLVLQALYRALLVPQTSADNFVTASVEPIAKSLCKIWGRYHNDPYVAEDIVFVFAALAKCQPPGPGKLRDVLGPLLASILSQPPDKNPSLTASALDVLEAVVAAPSSPLSRFYVERLFLLAVRIGMTTDEPALAQTVSSVLACYAQAAFDQLDAARFLNGEKSGLVLVLQYAHRLLTNAAVPDHALPYVDALVVQLLLRSDRLPPAAVAGLLRAVWQKMLATTFPTVRQSMLFVFVRLFASAPLFALKFLAQQQGPDGASAVPTVLSAWLKTHADFLGVYRQKISCIGLVNLLKLNDARINAVTVPDKLLVDVSEGRRLRGAGRLQEKYTQIPLPAKIVKVLVAEHQERLAPEAELSNSDDSDDMLDLDSDDDDDDDEYGGGDAHASPFAPAEDYDAYLVDGDDDDDDGDDISPQIDPLNKTDFIPFLTQNLAVIYATPALRSLVGPALSAQEKDYISGLQSD